MSGDRTDILDVQNHILIFVILSFVHPYIIQCVLNSNPKSKVIAFEPDLGGQTKKGGSIHTRLSSLLCKATIPYKNLLVTPYREAPLLALPVHKFASKYRNRF